MEKFGSILLYGFLRLIQLTCRFEQIHRDQRDKAIGRSPFRSFIMVCWHEHLIGASLGQTGEPRLSPIASRSGAGRVIGQVLSNLGFVMVYGSQNRNGKDKGGKAARDQLINSIKSGLSPALTVDGSIGPRRFCKPGALDLSRQTCTLIVPTAAVCSRFWTLNTWDKMQIPKPFSKIIIVFGEALEPIDPKLSKTDFLQLQNEIGKRINQAEDMGYLHLKHKYGLTPRRAAGQEI